jgi:hypothetical protein
MPAARFAKLPGTRAVSCGHVALPGEVHAFESVEVVSSASFDELLEEFWATVTLTIGGPPSVSKRRAKYHCAIVARDADQEAAARASVRQMETRLGRAVAVPVLRADFKAKEAWRCPGGESGAVDD